MIMESFAATSIREVDCQPWLLAAWKNSNSSIFRFLVPARTGERRKLGGSSCLTWNGMRALIMWWLINVWLAPARYRFFGCGNRSACQQSSSDYSFAKVIEME